MRMRGRLSPEVLIWNARRLRGAKGGRLGCTSGRRPEVVSPGMRILNFLVLIDRASSPSNSNLTALYIMLRSYTTLYAHCISTPITLYGVVQTWWRHHLNVYV